ncbi:MAG: D-alanine--D-alanine ligase [Clostridium sp. SCN 57-10]|nr:MAG: D-alanine--D-alanine ligase [Clostridium sp. SCN 57-10]
MKIRVGVFFGGKTVEHEVSVISAMQAIAALDREKYEVVPVYITKDNRLFTGQVFLTDGWYRDIPAALSTGVRVLPVREGNAVQLMRHPAPRFGKAYVAAIDVALPVVHGTNVEDGALQGFLEYLDLPYAGPDVASAAAGMDKWTMKALFRAAHVPVCDGVRFTAAQWFADADAARARVLAAVGLPCVVKPVNLGSSVGIGFARDEDALAQCVTDAFSYAPVVLCERAVQNLREINCAVLGDRDGARVSVCEEPLNATDVLTYRDKYMAPGGAKGGKSGGGGMAQLARQVPAALSPEQTERAQSLALQAFQAIDASGCARVDLLMDGATGEFCVNEINTIPGSLAFYLWEASGLSFSALLDEMIALALKRRRELDGLQRSFDVNLLQSASLGGAKGAKRA